MKRTLTCRPSCLPSAFCLLTFLLLLPQSVSANTAPVVSNVRASQRPDDSKLVDIHYDLYDADGDACTVWVVASRDGGATWRVPILTVWGHTGKGVAPGLNRHIVWDAGQDMAGLVGDFKVRVYADDGHSADGLVLIPGGEFKMGDSFDEGYSNELPAHWVWVDAFMVSRYEVTNQQYVEFLNNVFSEGKVEVRDGVVYKKGTNYAYCDTYDATHYSRIAFTVSQFYISPPDKANHPMVKVSWYGAAAYCNWRSEQLGKELCYNPTSFTPDLSRHGCRLPTEAEWEWAARGGFVGKRFPWGDTINHDYANYQANGSAYTYDTSPYTSYTYHPTYAGGDKPYTAPVGSFSANGYGLYDMAGNVWEWCNDWYDGGYYNTSPYWNPPGPSGSRLSRVLRGGAWNSHAINCRVADRHYGTPSSRDYGYGFRLLLDLN